MEKIFKGIPQDVLDPWTEIVGTLVDMDEDSVTIATTHEYTLPIEPHELKRCAAELKRGSPIGILLLPDGSLRVRSISSEPHRGGLSELPMRDKSKDDAGRNLNSAGKNFQLRSEP